MSEKITLEQDDKIQSTPYAIQGQGPMHGPYAGPYQNYGPYSGAPAQSQQPANQQGVSSNTLAFMNATGGSQSGPTQTTSTTNVELPKGDGQTKPSEKASAQGGMGMISAFTQLGSSILNDNLKLFGSFQNMAHADEQMEMAKEAANLAEKWRQNQFNYQQFMARKDLEMKEKQFILNEMQARLNMRNSAYGARAQDYAMRQQILSSEARNRIGNAMAVGMMAAGSEARK